MKRSARIKVALIGVAAVVALVGIIELRGYFSFRAGTQFDGPQEYSVSMKGYASGQNIELERKEDQQMLFDQFAEVIYGGCAVWNGPISQEDGGYSVMISSNDRCVWFIVMDGDTDSILFANDVRVKLRNTSGLYACVNQLFRQGMLEREGAVN